MKFAIRFADFPIFRDYAGTFGFAQISQLAATVEEASEKELYQQLQALIALITETVAVHDKNNRRILVVDNNPGVTSVCSN